jgi:hypothetical protein
MTQSIQSSQSHPQRTTHKSHTQHTESTPKVHKPTVHTHITNNKSRITNHESRSRRSRRRTHKFAQPTHKVHSKHPHARTTENSLKAQKHAHTRTAHKLQRTSCSLLTHAYTQTTFVLCICGWWCGWWWWWEQVHGCFYRVDVGIWSYLHQEYVNTLQSHSPRTNAAVEARGQRPEGQRVSGSEGQRVRGSEGERVRG